MPGALLDTSVVIDWALPEVAAALPVAFAISAITLAELTAGPILATDAEERAERLNRLQIVESAFEPIPFEAHAARSYGRIVAAVTGRGRIHRSRVADLLIAATAHANEMTLFTRNPDDFVGLEALIEVRAI